MAASSVSPQRPEDQRAQLQRLQSIRSVVAELRQILMDPELACSPEILNATRPQLEAAVAELGALDLGALGPGVQNVASRERDELNHRVTEQLHLLHSELHRTEALRSNASEFWKGWSKLLGVEPDPAGTSYSPAGIEESIRVVAGVGNLSVKG